jgi:hypothetical protein
MAAENAKGTKKNRQASGGFETRPLGSGASRKIAQAGQIIFGRSV